LTMLGFNFAYRNLRYERTFFNINFKEENNGSKNYNKKNFRRE